MAKFTGLDEYIGSQRAIYVEQEGAHVTVSVEATSGSNQGTALVTPAQARAISTALLKAAEGADQWETDQ